MLFALLSVIDIIASLFAMYSVFLGGSNIIINLLLGLLFFKGFISVKSHRTSLLGWIDLLFSVVAFTAINFSLLLTFSYLLSVVLSFKGLLCLTNQLE